MKHTLYRMLVQRNYQHHEPHVDDPLPNMVLRGLDYVSRYFKVSIHQHERIPRQGPALLVSNHALLGIDGFALMPELVKVAGRYPRALMLRSLFEVPVFGEMLQELGGVPGTRELANELLGRGKLVVVYPGGSRDSLKGRSERYHLKWGERCGFAHVAITSQSPIIPMAAIGPDEVFPILSDRGLLQAGFLGKAKIPLFLPLARRVPFAFHVGEPIAPPPIPEDGDLEAAARQHATLVRRALETMIWTKLRERDRRQESVVAKTLALR